MDYYQGVVLDYVRADRAVFVNPECCIQLIFLEFIKSLHSLAVPVLIHHVSNHTIATPQD